MPNVVQRRIPVKPLDVMALGRRTKGAIRNGRTELPQVFDGRCGLAKRFKEIAAQVLIDQGEGISEIRLQMIRRFVGCCVLAEQIEKQIVRGKHTNTDEYAQLIGAIVRVASRLGIDRVPKVVTPSLRDYLDQKTVDETPAEFEVSEVSE